MPNKPKKPCKHPGCPSLTDGSYCEDHGKLHTGDRPGASRRGYDSRWRKAKKIFLDSHPLCVHCMKDGKLTKAVAVDHVIPHRGDQNLFWDQGNWQALCIKCHNRKTRMEDQHPTYKY